MSDQPEKAIRNDSGPLDIRVEPVTGDRWLRFCHGQGREPNQTAAIALNHYMEAAGKTTPVDTLPEEKPNGTQEDQS